MKALLYFQLDDISTARTLITRIGELAESSTHHAEPWFVSADGQPVDGLPRIHATHTTYSDEIALAAACAGAIVSTLAVFHYGVFHGTGSMLLAYAGGLTLGAMLGWWIGALAGAKIERAGLRRQRRQLMPGQMAMVVLCAAESRETVRALICEQSGVAETDAPMPHARWTLWSA